VVPIEELIWSKLYVLQFDRSDWPEIVNLIALNPGRIDWERLVSRLGDDVPLLIALLTIAAWVRPDFISRLPAWLAEKIYVEGEALAAENLTERRAALLDTRPWLTPKTEKAA